jgi:limonene-1,2-epoxide hydrolase
VSAKAAVARFLAAVESMDAEAVGACFTDDATYQNVPHPPAMGRDAIAAMFRPILSRSHKVQWDIVSSSYAEDMAWLERVDRFWIDGTEYHIECNGVGVVDPASGKLTAFRDYVDIGTWRQRTAGIDLSS